ncbi:uncharacterized protein LOC112486771 [Cynoglossus semilaevis]|uniref:Nuclear factor, interleukin 3 regulated, member 4 n=1 Tax=Cynoglossus semilaevis TaxID=244447 RepID=A0A3P8V2Z8_CYNSE|nr:uncharacterized protein LOC112486771 [Cynoglossus semilaevis]
MEALPTRKEQDDNFSQAENEFVNRGARRKRKFIPEENKDATYWEKRRKNNEAAKRSREKRRMSDYVLETHFMALKEENARLMAELTFFRLHFGQLHPTAALGPYTRSHGGSQHHSLQRNYCWTGRDSSLMPGQQLSPPLYVPTFASSSLRGYPQFHTYGGTRPGVFTPLVLTRNPLTTCPSHVQGGLQHPPKALSDEEDEEQQVPGMLPSSSSTQPFQITYK